MSTLPPMPHGFADKWHAKQRRTATTGFIPPAKPSQSQLYEDAWAAAMECLTLDEATILQLKGGRGTLRAVFEDGMNRTNDGTAFPYFTDDSRANASLIRFPEPQKRVRNEVESNNGFAWFENGWWETDSRTIVARRQRHRDAIGAVIAIAPESMDRDRIYPAVLALRDTPTMLVDHSDPRPAI